MITFSITLSDEDIRQMQSPYSLTTAIDALVAIGLFALNKQNDGDEVIYLDDLKNADDDMFKKIVVDCIAAYACLRKEQRETK